MGPKVVNDMKFTIKEALKDIFNDDEFIDKVFVKITEKLNALEVTITNQRKYIGQLENQVQSLQQRSKINNICIYNLDEEQGEKTTDKVLNLFNAKLKTNIRKEDIVRAHRVGKNNGKTRPIIVKFERYQHKALVFKNCSNLKGTQIGIMEDLQKKQFQLYREAIQIYDKRLVFTNFGDVFVKMNNKIKKIHNSADLSVSNNKN